MNADLLSKYEIRLIDIANITSPTLQNSYLCDVFFRITLINTFKRLLSKRITDGYDRPSDGGRVQRAFKYMILTPNQISIISSNLNKTEQHYIYGFMKHNNITNDL